MITVKLLGGMEGILKTEKAEFKKNRKTNIVKVPREEALRPRNQAKKKNG